jgi:hypothetical protein
MTKLVSSQVTDDMILYLRDPQNSFSKITGYKICIQKSVAFLYTSNKKAEKEIRQTIPFIIASKIVKYLEINLTKEMKELLNEHSKLLKRENKEDIRIWKDLL